MNKQIVERGDIWFSNLPQGTGCEFYGDHPVLIIQNQKGQRYSPTAIVACISSKLKKPNQPTHVPLNEPFLDQPSQVCLVMIKTIDNSRLKWKMGSVSKMKQKQIDSALAFSVGLGNLTSLS